jgi:hypothetical protein
MPSHPPRGRQLTRLLAPGLEPLEDRILLSGAATAGATHAYSHPPSGQSPPHSYGSAAVVASRAPAEARTALDASSAQRTDAATPAYSPLSYVTGLLASLPSREYYASHTGCPVEPPRASPHREETPPKPPSEPPVAAPASPAPPGQALVSAAVSSTLRLAAPVSRTVRRSGPRRLDPPYKVT